MKRFAVLTIPIFLAGCWAEETSTKVDTGEDGSPTYSVSVKGCEGSTTYHVVVVDGCQYLWSGAGSMGQFAHKGNCKACRDHLANVVRENVK